jgi:hypothetical protein
MINGQGRTLGRSGGRQWGVRPRTAVVVRATLAIQTWAATVGPDPATLAIQTWAATVGPDPTTLATQTRAATVGPDPTTLAIQTRAATVGQDMRPEQRDGRVLRTSSAQLSDRPGRR